MQARELLVIDDDEYFTCVWAHILTQEGFTVTTVPNMVEARAYLQKQIPHVIICDVNLPELDAFAFCKFLKASPRTQNIPVVMVSALGDDRKRKLSQKCGAKGYLEKPFGRRQLMTVLDKVLAHAI